MTLVVNGLKEVSRAFALAERETRLAFNTGMRAIAEPVQRDAENLAKDDIRNIGKSWWKMRIGQTRGMVYVAPRNRGIKGRGVGGMRRPKFAGLLMDRSMEPALHRNEPEIARGVDAMMSRVAHDFNTT